MNITRRFTISCVLLAGVSLSHAQSEGQRRGRTQIPLIKALDLDGDGALSTEEMDKAAASLWALDSNEDKSLSAGEIMPAQRSSRGATVGDSRSRRGGGGPRPTELGATPLDLGEPGIAWYGRLEDGKAEAKRSNRPILFMAAASQCGGVPGVF